MPPQADGSSLWSWPCVQWWKVFCQTTISDFLWMYIWQGWGISWPCWSKCTAEHVSSETPTQLQKFLGMVIYLSPFVPSPLSYTAPIHELLKKGTNFTWNQSNQEAFDIVKCLVCTHTTLWYFNVHKPSTVWVDASWKGPGATLLQVPPSYLCTKSPNTCRIVLGQHRA